MTTSTAPTAAATADTKASSSSNSNPTRWNTVRDISTTLSILSSNTNELLNDVTIHERVNTMTKYAKEAQPFTDEEVQGICNSIRNMIPSKTTDKSQDHDIKENAPLPPPPPPSIDFDALGTFLQSVAHLSHKDWTVTDTNSDKLGRLLQLISEETTTHTPTTPLSSLLAQQFLTRILTEGNWQGAVDHAPPTGMEQRRPWAVLVTGVNGIRKTTSLYQPWFEQVLSEALCSPQVDTSSETPLEKKPKNLPTGQNSFFRQLDHMICTLTNEEFARLYAWASDKLSKEQQQQTNATTKSSLQTIPSNDIVQDYSNYKAAIFSRYRTLSELLGAFLLKEAQKLNINCLVETSGKDVAMFHYIDHFFGSKSSDNGGDGNGIKNSSNNNNNGNAPQQPKYNKLVLRFVINDLDCAKQSVDQRMIQEIQTGTKAILPFCTNTCDSSSSFSSEKNVVWDIVHANAGGPYGSQVLEGVQKDSDMVWESQVASGNVGKDWYKATIAIQAHSTKPWTAQAVKPDGTLGTSFSFV